MFKGFALFYLLSMLTRNPLLALVLLVVLYAVADRAYFGFLPDFYAPFRRNGRIRELKAELEVNPANADSAQELGILYYEQKEFKKSLEYLEKAHEKVKNSARLYLYMGMAYTETNRLDKGRQALEKALETDRKVGHGLPYIYLMGYELSTGGSDTDRMKSLEGEFRSFASTENFYRMGIVYKRKGLRIKAREMFEQAIDEYSYIQGRLRRLHRKWAVYSRLRSMGL